MGNMRFVGATLVLVCLAVVAAGPLAGCRSCPPVETTEKFSVAALLEEVKDALQIAGQQLAAKDAPALESVTLALQTVASSETDGSLNFYILQLGTQTTKTLTSRITLTLRPVYQPGMRTETKLASGLADAIVAAWNAEKVARTAIPGLRPKDVSCEISFGVQRKGTAGLTLVVAPVTGSLGGAFSAGTVQTITINFEH